MEIWVQNIKTKKAWILDSDVTKEVFTVNGQTTYKKGDASMWCYRFYPCDPNHCEKLEKDTFGYQFNIMDYLEGSEDGIQ